MIFFRKIILLFCFIPYFGFSQDIPISPSSCNEQPVINSIFFSPPPNSENEDGIMTISGKEFPESASDTRVTLAGENLIIISASETVILTKVRKNDYKEGSYRVEVTKTRCLNRYATMDATITNNSSSGSTTEFITRKTTSFTIFPNSYAEVEVACNADEKAISGGFIFATWEIKLVSSYPDGRYWRFKVYNNENLTSWNNEFFAICAH